MKKIIIAVLALLSFGVAEAQFKVIGNDITTYVVYPMRAGVSLKYTKIGEVAEYYLQLNTTNQFDKSMLIYLGNRDNARASLKQMLNELFAPDLSTELQDNNGKPFIVVGSIRMGAKGFAVFREGYAGHAYIRLSQIEDMLGIM